jgi:hypothetical protein
VTTLLLVRHGETDWNAERRWQGHADVPMNDRGLEQQRTGDPARDAGGLERVRQARAEVVAFRVDEHLRLQPQAPEGLRVDDAVAVALERRPQPAFLLGKVAPARLVRAHGERRQPTLLVLAHEAREGISNLTGKLRHPGSSVVAAAEGARRPLETWYTREHRVPTRPPLPAIDPIRTGVTRVMQVRVR